MSLDVIMDPETGDLPDFCRLATGRDLIAQRVRARTLTHKGDWPLDKDAGIDWLAIVTTRPADPAAIAATLAVEWVAVPGVLSVESLDFSQEGDQVTVSATLLTEEGPLEIVVTPQGIDGNPSVGILLTFVSTAVIP